MALIAEKLLPEFREGTSVISPVISMGMEALIKSDDAPEAGFYHSLVEEVKQSEYDKEEALADWFRYVERHWEDIVGAFGGPVTFEPTGDFSYMFPGSQPPPFRWYTHIGVDVDDDSISEDELSSDEDIFL